MRSILFFVGATMMVGATLFALVSAWLYAVFGISFVHESHATAAAIGMTLIVGVMLVGAAVEMRDTPPEAGE